MDSLDQFKRDVIDIVLAVDSDVRAIYIYGSIATGNETKNSDADIALRCYGEVPFQTRMSLVAQLQAKLKREVDLLDMSSVSTVMRMQVVSNGQRIYCADHDEAENYDDLVFLKYARFNEERAGILEDIKKRGTIYG